MQMFNNKLLMQTKEVAKTPINLHFCLSEIWNVSLQIWKRVESFTAAYQHINITEKINNCKQINSKI